jgi:hypothetical protein
MLISLLINLSPGFVSLILINHFYSFCYVSSFHLTLVVSVSLALILLFVTFHLNMHRWF